MKKVFQLVILLCVMLLGSIFLHPFEVQAASEGDLTFMLNSNNTGYTVSSCSSTAQGEMVIPAVYEGKPVTDIGENAFSYCTNLTSITIPDNVTSIGNSAFKNCTKLKTVNFNATNCTTMGSSYSYSVFSGCTNLTTVNIGSNVTTIPAYAFYECTNLTNVTFPDSVENISDCAFFACENLTDITIPGSVENIGFKAFSGCTGLVCVTVENGVKSIGELAFYYCTKLKDVTIADSVVSIGSNAFYLCNQLNYNVLDEGRYLGNRSNPYMVFIETISQNITTCKISSDTRIIYSSAFKECVELTSITIPDSVVSVGEYAFDGCAVLTNVTFGSGVTCIGEYAFRDCIRLTSICIPDSVKTIGVNAFSNCTGLTNVTIGNGVTCIDSYAFSNCAGLKTVAIPDSVTQVGQGAFWGCSQLETMTLSARYSFKNMFKSSMIETKIPASLKHITITGGQIGSAAFSGCTQLTSVTIGNGVTSIGDKAFYGCNKLTSITIPDSVTSVGFYAFADCTGLTDMYINPNTWCKSATEESRDYVDNIHFTDENGNEITDIVLDNTVTEIPGNAFKNCTTLTSIIIPDSVTEVSYTSFDGCTGLKKVVLGNGLDKIPAGLLSGCSELEMLTIPFVGAMRNTDQDLPLHTFGYIFGRTPYEGAIETIQAYCYDISSNRYETYYVPASLQSVTVTGGNIGYGAFYNCSNLTTLRLGDGVTSIGRYAFENCTGLKDVYVHPSTWCKITFDYGANPMDYADNLHFVDTHGNEVTDIVLDNSVTTIPRSRFENCKQLTSIIIPNNVTSIGEYAFSGCTGLTTVTIGDSVTSIGEYAFSGCTGLTTVTIGDSVTSIGEYAFYNCTGLTGVYITDLSAWCNIQFNNSESNPLHYAKKLYLNGELITKLVVPSNVKTISSYAFYNCTGLTSATIGNSVKSIGEYAFYNCTGLTSVVIPDGVTSIDNRAFFGCASLTSVTIGNGVESIGDSAFYNCAGLTSITIPDSVESIGEYAFYNCTGLTSVVIPDSVESVGDYAFYGCTGLTTVTIGDSVTHIGYYAFRNCTGLVDVYVHPSTWCKITFDYGANPMDYADNLHFVDTHGNEVTDIVLDNSVTTIPRSRFENCKQLTSIIIPNNVTSIGEYAFSGCTGLTTVTIGDSVTSIGEYAFSGCTGLTTVTIGDSVTSIGEYAFYNCSSLTDVYVTDPNNWCKITFDGWRANPMENADNLHFVDRDGREVTDIVLDSSITTILDYAFANCKNLTSIAIPDSVKSIGRSAFYGCTGLTSVTIPDSVTSIGGYAFSRCTSLTSITIPDSVTSIGGGAFDNCTSLTSITIPDSVTSIDSSVFYNCTGLTSVTIPDSVTSIGSSAFYGCTGLTSVTIGNGVESIGAGAFGRCTGLTNVYVKNLNLWCKIDFESANTYGTNPMDYAENLHFIDTEGNEITEIVLDNSVTTIPENLFKNCKNMTGITIPNSVTRIDHYAFSGCSGLTSVTIPGSVQSIGEEAFSGCTGLTHVIFKNGVQRIGYRVFDNCSSLRSVVLPVSATSIDRYAFANCTGLTDVWYQGSISDKSGNYVEFLYSATWHYNTCEEHTYSGSCDCSCNRCEWIRVTKEGHTYDNACDTGCNVCGEERNTSHNFVSATCTAPKRCTVCGTTQGAALGHCYIQKVVAPTYTKQGYTQYTCGNCGDSYKDTYTKAKGLPAPSVKIANDAKTGKPSISWKAVSEVSSYDVYRATAKSGSYSKLATVTTTSYTDSSAALGKTYYYKVIAVCKSDSKLNSEASSIVSILTKCGQPMVKVSVSSKGKVTVSWSKVSGAKKYDVYYATSQNGTYKKLTSTTKTSYSHTKASAGKEYFYKVRAYSTTATTGAFSNASRAVIKLATPSLTVTAKNGQATIKWKKITGATKYELQCSTNGGVYKTIATVSGTSYTHKGLAGGNKYTYRLRAVSSVKDAASAYSAVKTAVVKCAAPTITVSLSGNAPVIKWSKVSGAVKYQVYYATSKSGKYKAVGTVTGTSFTHSGAPAAKACYYKVVAVDKNGNQGTYSSVKNITTKCLAPANVKVTRNAKKQPVITWSKVSGAKKYEVYVATSPNGTYKKLTTTTKLTYTYTKGKAGTTYYFKVTAYGSSTASKSPYSAVVKTP